MSKDKPIKAFVTHLEVVSLANGDVVLRRAGDTDESEYLLRISFSKEAKKHMNKSHLEVARRMIDAGMEDVAWLLPVSKVLWNEMEEIELGGAEEEETTVQERRKQLLENLKGTVH